MARSFPFIHPFIHYNTHNKSSYLYASEWLEWVSICDFHTHIHTFSPEFLEHFVLFNVFSVCVICIINWNIASTTNITCCDSFSIELHAQIATDPFANDIKFKLKKVLIFWVSKQNAFTSALEFSFYFLANRKRLQHFILRFIYNRGNSPCSAYEWAANWKKQWESCKKQYVWTCLYFCFILLISLFIAQEIHQTHVKIVW